MTESQTATVYHPTLDASQEVPKADVAAWAEQGWLKSKPSRKSGDNTEGN